MWYGWYILCYVVLLGILLHIQQKQRKSYASVLHDFEWEIDRRRYLYTKQIVLHKKSIHDYEGNVDALFATKKRVLSSEKKSYISDYEQYKSDLDYIEQLLGEKLVSEAEISKADKLYTKLLNIRQGYNSWKMILLVCTLGLYSIWQQPLLD